MIATQQNANALEKSPKKGKSSNHANVNPKTEVTTREENPATDSNSNRLLTNSHGGVYVGRQELVDAFSMLDLDKSGHITVNNLKKRLGVFFPDLSTKEYRFMMNNKKEVCALHIN